MDIQADSNIWEKMLLQEGLSLNVVLDIFCFAGNIRRIKIDGKNTDVSKTFREYTRTWLIRNQEYNELENGGNKIESIRLVFHNGIPDYRMVLLTDRECRYDRGLLQMNMKASFQAA